MTTYTSPMGSTYKVRKVPNTKAHAVYIKLKGSDGWDIVRAFPMGEKAVVQEAMDSYAAGHEWGVA